ncbi:hypothetical protein LTR85_009062 [Meristemomyces frigidus]|nr:hypothetical protein LTR85_009062 [Meristemomyces frigidus]
MNSGHLEVVKLLLENGTYLSTADTHGWTPVNCAANNGHLEVVKLLLKNGADFSTADTYGWTPVNWAANNGHLQIVKLLLWKGADLSIASTNGWTPVNSAAYNGHLEVVKLLFDKDQNEDDAQAEGLTEMYVEGDQTFIEIDIPDDNATQADNADRQDDDAPPTTKTVKFALDDLKTPGNFTKRYDALPDAIVESLTRMF